MVVPTGYAAVAAKILPQKDLSRKKEVSSSSTAAASVKILPQKDLSGKNEDGSPTATAAAKILPEKHLSGKNEDGSPTAAAAAKILPEKHLSGKNEDDSPTAAAAAKVLSEKYLSGINGDDSSWTAVADESSDGDQSLSLSEALYSKSYGAVPVGIFMTVPVRPPRDRLNVADIGPEATGRIVLVQGFAQAIKKVRKNLTLIILREGLTSIKCVLDGDDPGISNDMVCFVRKLNKESFVEVEGTIETMHGTEQIRVRKLYCVDEAGGLRKVSFTGAGMYPWSSHQCLLPCVKVWDHMQKGKKLAHVSLSVRLNRRFFDLRVRATQAVFWIQSEVTTHFMQFMIKGGFMCTHTPKITGVSEGGSAVFKVNYFKDRTASLAQSPQLYRQMLINGGINRVFEIGPVFRAEDSNTHRHLCEYIGLHAEMQIKEHYFEVIDFVDALFVDIFDHLAKNCSEMLDMIQEQYPCERLMYLQQNVRLKYSEGIKMLQESGFPIQEPEDLNNKAELMLGKLVREKYKTDFFILYEYPLALRPFYTMPSTEKRQPGSYSNSFDVFIRGQEVLSGSQRIHNKSLLIKRIDEWGYNKATFQQFTNTFGCGAPPRGGFGAGLERLVMLYLGVSDIRIASLFPRDPGRLAP